VQDAEVCHKVNLDAWKKRDSFFPAMNQTQISSCLAYSLVTYTNCAIPYNISSPELRNFRRAVPSPCYLVCEAVEEYSLL